MMTHILIDPPVGPYSTMKELNAWRNALLRMRPRAPQVAQALEDVEDWIDARAKMDTPTGAQQQ